MPRKVASSSDSRLQWRKRKRSGANISPSSAAAAENSDDSDSAAADDDSGEAQAPADDPVLNLREAEVLSAAETISAFPPASRRAVNRLHPSVLAGVAAARSSTGANCSAAVLENISHGQLQVLSLVLPDHPSLSDDPDKPSSYVCAPPPLMEGCGVTKKFQDHLLMVPKHSNWFSPVTVHRLERQVVPHFFSGKSPGNTLEKYVMLRNKIIERYLECPGRRLAFTDCQGLVASMTELYDLSRIFRFLDNWGIINYVADGSVHRGFRMAASLLREEPTGELQLLSAPLKSIDSLVLFDRPKCGLQTKDIASLASSSSASDVADSYTALADMDEKIRERLSESSCSYCSQPLPSLHYESQKEANIALCSDCFHDARYITGHTSLDFQRVDGKKDGSGNAEDNWTDQETLLLLEGLEKYNDNWHDIADHVRTKSKAQCIHHFIRLPVEDGLLENIEAPDASREKSNGVLHSNSNGNTSGRFPECIQPGNQLPFINSANPVMSLVSFLASAIGPRVAASCANAVLCILTRDDSRMSSESMHAEGVCHAAHSNHGDHSNASTFSPENVKYAAMCGLSAAAMKSKLFADQEEREIQRLTATIINHQLKRLELKLKQFAEVETLILKECEQAERVRQSLSADRFRVMSARLASTGSTLPGGSSTVGSNPMIQANPQPAGMLDSTPQAGMPTAYAKNLQGHPQMPFLQQHQQQQQMRSFGPRLSEIHSLQSVPAPNVMFN